MPSDRVRLVEVELVLIALLETGAIDCLNVAEVVLVRVLRFVKYGALVGGEERDSHWD